MQVLTAPFLVAVMLAWAVVSAFQVVGIYMYQSSVLGIDVTEETDYFDEALN